MKKNVTVSQSEDNSSVIFVEGICLQLNIILLPVHLTENLPFHGARKEKPDGYLLHSIKKTRQKANIKSWPVFFFEKTQQLVVELSGFIVLD